MPLIDARGRIFGRLNVIDASLVAFVLLLLPIGFTAARLFRLRTPVIDKVEPAEQPVGRDRRISIHGHDLRPFLRAFVAPTGKPFSLIDRVREGGEGVVSVETPEDMEVVLPDIAEGSYDLYLYDESREVAHRIGAFVLKTPPVVERTLKAKVRFVVSPNLVNVIKAGDADVTERAPIKLADPPPGPAVLTAVRVLGRGPAMFEMMQVPHRARWFGRTQQDGMVIDASVTIPAHQTREGIWEYGELPIRAGDPLFFQTPRYSISGIIDEVNIASQTGAPPAVPKAGK
jgi:hypothetical protein